MANKFGILLPVVGFILTVMVVGLFIAPIIPFVLGEIIKLSVSFFLPKPSAFKIIPITGAVGTVCLRFNNNDIAEEFEHLNKGQI